MKNLTLGKKVFVMIAVGVARVRMTDSWNAEYLNNRERCILCFQPPYIEEMHGLTGATPLIKHHVTYFPEKIAFVHYDCHKKIHGDPPMTMWIQYADGDARKFYAIKQEKENGQVDKEKQEKGKD